MFWRRESEIVSFYRKRDTGSSSELDSGERWREVEAPAESVVSNVKETNLASSGEPVFVSVLWRRDRELVMIKVTFPDDTWWFDDLDDFGDKI